MKVAALVALIAGASSHSFAQASNLCFAFVLRGDITVACGGQHAQITRQGDITGFAVSEGPAAFAYNSPMAGKTMVVDLRSGLAKAAGSVPGIVSTCGGIFPNQARQASDYWDIANGKAIDVQPYVWFRCSSDGKTVVGASRNLGVFTSKEHDADLYEGLPPQTDIVPAGSFGAFTFNVSPNGSTVGYYDDKKNLLCTYRSGVRTCVDGLINGTVAVNDSGEVLVAYGTPEMCYFRSESDFSNQPIPGWRNKDECSGIGYWKPGRTTIEQVEPVGVMPQWVTPATAELLRKWSSEVRGRNSGKDGR